MDKNRVMMIGRKESFITRVLTKKLSESDVECEFVHWSVNEINSKWEGTHLVTLYMEENDRPPEDVIQFLKDRLDDEGVLFIPIGEKTDIQYILEHMPGEMIYKTFIRPVDNAEFANTITDLMNKLESGEFKKTILIVDDDPNYLSLVREWLKGTYKVAMANSGLQALKWLGKNKADLILLDHEMPVTSGPQVLEMLRSEEETKSIPVMFLTGKSDKNSVMAVVALKPEGYFLKTIGREELLEKLSEFFILHRSTV